MSSTVTTTTAPAKELGFSIKQGANWDEYLSFRPAYPSSFFNRIYDYHSQKSEAGWSVEHDNGAGVGVFAVQLATRFHHVIVSDPNEGYTNIARKLLVDDSGISESKFRFLQEGAEKSSVDSGTVDMITAGSCIHWTDTATAIREFARELKVGGTVAITHYTFPNIVGNVAAERAWKAIYATYSDRARDEMMNRAFEIINTGLECLEFPTEDWEKVTRVYINAHRDIRTFETNERVGQSKFQAGEQRVWVDDDQDWCHEKDIAWLKGYMGTWMPRLPESDVQGLWDELERALGGGTVKLETPVAMVFATRKSRSTA